MSEIEEKAKNLKYSLIYSFLTLAVLIFIYVFCKKFAYDRQLIRSLTSNDTIIMPLQNVNNRNDLPEVPEIQNVVNGTLVNRLDENLVILEGKIIN